MVNEISSKYSIDFNMKTKYFGFCFAVPSKLNIPNFLHGFNLTVIPLQGLESSVSFLAMENVCRKVFCTIMHATLSNAAKV